MIRHFRRALAVVLFCLAGSVAANGIIIIPPPYPPPWPPHPPRPPVVRPQPTPWREMTLAVKQANLKVRIETGSATTEVDQVFHNPHPRQVEGTFLFPLPSDAAISAFSMFVDGKELKGEVLDKDQANKIYEDIVRQAQDPAILEYMDRRLIRARIFPIPARGDVRITFRYSETLRYDAGLYTYRYPLNTNKYSPQPLETCVISAEIRSRRPIKAVYSPTHSVDVRRADDHSATVGYEASKVTPDRDFVLHYAVSEEAVGASAISYRTGTEDGYFLLLVAPELKTDGAEPPAKDVAFVFDTSGSMRVHDKMSQARRALEYCLKALSSRDRFAIVDFSTTVRTFREQLVPADARNVEEALQYVSRLDARGATNIEEALSTALKMGRDGDRPYYVIFMTDGLPTVGERDPVKLSEMARSQAGPHVRLFTFGVGYDVNTALLDRMAEENRGARAYVTPEEDLEHHVSSFYSKIASPAMSDVVVNIEPADTYDLFPRRLPDLFRGGQIEIAGRYRRPGPIRITVKGKVDKVERVYVFEDKLAESDATHEHLPHLWAVRKVGYLLDEARLRGISKELREEIIRLSTKYGIVTPYTAYLVVEDTAPAPPAAMRQRRAFQESARALSAPEMAPQRDRMGVFRRGAAGDARQEGEAAVGMSQDLAQLREGRVAETLPAPVQAQVQRQIQNVGNQAYYFDNNRWEAATWEEGKPTRQVEYLSDEYFQLARQKPALARAFALGPLVVAEVEGVFYEVVMPRGEG